MGRAQLELKPLLAHPSPAPWFFCTLGYSEAGKTWNFSSTALPAPVLCRNSPRQVHLKVWFTFINTPDIQSWHSWNNSHQDPQTLGHRNDADGVWQTQSSEITWNNFVFLDVAPLFSPEFPFKDFAEFSLKLPCLLVLLTDFIALQKPQ